MNRLIALTCLLVVGLFSTLPGLQDPKEGSPLAKELRASIDANLDASNKRDLDAYMATIHPKSMSYEPTRRQMGELNKRYELSFKVTHFSVMGSDADYAVARIRQETRKVKGPEFRDNEVDSLQIFRKDKDAWKVWSSAVLEVKYFE